MNPPSTCLKDTEEITVAGIILAAGQSTRMGQPKQLLAFKNQTILGQVVDTALESDLHDIIVVVGHEAERMRPHLDGRNLKIIFNKDYAKGQHTSIQAGINAVSRSCHGAMFLLSDQPLVKRETINTLIRAFCRSTSALVIPYYKKKRGNPVIIRRDLWPELMGLPPDTGARAIFHRHKEKILKVDANDEGIVFDVDTREDYRKLTKIS
jgi:molybdenum cofactor cytidylyltransferase